MTDKADITTVTQKLVIDHVELRKLRNQIIWLI